jgi:hypothetical protein
LLPPGGPLTPAQRLGISVHITDDSLQAAFRSLHQLLAQDADLFTDVDRSLWYDIIEGAMRAPRGRAPASRGKEKRKAFHIEGDQSNFGGDRSNFEGDRSNSRGDAEKNARDADLSVAVTTES